MPVSGDLISCMYNLEAQKLTDDVDVDAGTLDGIIVDVRVVEGQVVASQAVRRGQTAETPGSISPTAFGLNSQLGVTRNALNTLDGVNTVLVDALDELARAKCIELLGVENTSKAVEKARVPLGVGDGRRDLRLRGEKLGLVDVVLERDNVAVSLDATGVLLHGVQLRRGGNGVESESSSNEGLECEHRERV